MDGTNSRTEDLLVTGVEETKKPLSRVEAILRGEDVKPLSRIEKALKEGGGSDVLYGEETPASSLGKDGDVYVQYKMSEMDIPVLVEDKTIPIGGSDDYITDVTATDYDTFLFVMDFYYPNDSTLFAHVEQIVKPNDITDGNYVSIRRPAYADVLGIINTASAPNEGKIQLSTPSWQYGVKYSIYDISSIILTPTTLVMPASEYSQGALYRSGIIVNDYNTIRLQVIMKNGDSRVDERCLDIDLDDVKNYDGPYGNDYPVFRPQTSNPLIFIRKDHLLSSGELVFIGGDSYDRYIDISVVSPLPSSEPGFLTDIYLKVNGEWVKDRFSDLDVNNVAQILKSDSKNYRVLLSNDATDNAEDAEANKSDKLMFNPKNGGLILGRLTLKEGENSVRGKIYLYYKDSANSITCLIDPYSGIMTDSENFDIDLSNSTWDGTNASLKAAILAAKNQYVEVSGVLMPGETTITLTDSTITTDSTFDYYTSIFGVNPTNAVVTSGRIVLTFEAQQTDMQVKVRVS